MHALGSQQAALRSDCTDWADNKVPWQEPIYALRCSGEESERIGGYTRTLRDDCIFHSSPPYALGFFPLCLLRGVHVSRPVFAWAIHRRTTMILLNLPAFGTMIWAPSSRLPRFAQRRPGDLGFLQPTGSGVESTARLQGRVSGMVLMETGEGEYISTVFDPRTCVQLEYKQG